MMPPPTTTQTCCRLRQLSSQPCRRSALAALSIFRSAAASWYSIRGRPQMRDLKSGPAEHRKARRTQLDLRPQIAEFFAYVRDADAGEIRELEVRHGLPFAMEIELEGGRRG